jgi:hypothetical protein
MGCTKVPSVELEMKNLIDATSMFENCTALKYAYLHTSTTAFTTANRMFKGCTNLEHIGSKVMSDGVHKPMNMNAVTQAEGMFENCTAFTCFYSLTPALINGGSMFAHSGLTKFKSGGTGETAQLPNLINGSYMFSHVKIPSVNILNVVAPKLVDGSYMFANSSIAYNILANSPTDSY